MSANYSLRNPVALSQDYVRVKMKIAFERSRFNRFDEGAFSLLCELGPNSNSVSRALDVEEPIILTACDADGRNDKNSLGGSIEVGISKDVLPEDVGIPLILAMSCYLATFKSVHRCTVLDISFPDCILDNGAFPQPAFGAGFIERGSRVRLGAIIKPRFASNAEYIKKFVSYAGRSGLDYISDDELTVGGRHLSSIDRMKIVIEALEKVADSGCRPKYIANITGNASSVHSLLDFAKEIGVDGVMVNAFSMGYEALSIVRKQCGSQLAMIVNGLGLGVLTRGPDFRLATELVAKLSRLSGADGFYTGPMVGSIDDVNHSAALLSSALTQPLGVSCAERLASGSFMSGGIGLKEIIANTMIYKAPLYLSMGDYFTDFFLSKLDGRKIVECIQKISHACEEEGVMHGRNVVLELSKRWGYGKLIEALNAEDAVSKKNT